MVHFSYEGVRSPVRTRALAHPTEINEVSCNHLVFTLHIIKLPGIAPLNTQLWMTSIPSLLYCPLLRSPHICTRPISARPSSIVKSFTSSHNGDSASSQFYLCQRGYTKKRAILKQPFLVSFVWTTIYAGYRPCLLTCSKISVEYSAPTQTDKDTKIYIALCQPSSYFRGLSWGYNPITVENRKVAKIDEPRRNIFAYQVRA